MKQGWFFLLIVSVLVALATFACGRSSSGEPTLVPTLPSVSGTVAGDMTSPMTPLSTLSPEATATPSPTPTATPTPSPTPTPLPQVLLREAGEALRDGNYAAAQSFYRALPLPELDESKAVTARLGLAQSLLEAEDYGGAVDVLRDFIAKFSGHPRAADAHFWLAEALVGQGEYLAAVDEYRAYLTHREVIAPYVQLWIGDAYSFAEAYEEAAKAYGKALDQAPTSDLVFRAREKLALAYGYAGEYDAALAQYDTILATSRDATLRARAQYQAAQTLLVAGEREAAYTRLYDLVNNYYKTASAYDALVDLVNSGQPVDDYQRGLVDYYNDAYDAAVAAFYRAIEADLEGHVGAPHYYAGLAYRASGNYAAAVVEFEKLIDTHPGDPHVDDAWLALAWSRYLAGDDDGAVETYTRFVADNGLNSLAAEALWWAANIRFWDDDYERAEPLFDQLADEHARSEYAADALYRAAFSRYRLEDYGQAAESWRRYTVDYPAGDLSVGAYFWRGRSYLAAGESLSATAAFSQAVSADPLDYYGQRALDYLADPDQPRLPFVPQSFDWGVTGTEETAERVAADLWLADSLGLTSTQAISLSQLSPLLSTDTRLQRGQELWHLGRWAEAKAELEWLRQDTATDLQTQYQLAVFFRDLGLYRSSILAANAAIRLSPARSPYETPNFLTRLAYPTYYAGLVLAEAQANDLEPSLIFALIRQESLFEGFATSYAFAHGLMQVIPSTGQSIANSLGWPDYETADLYRPFISVKFGTWYLAQQLDTFDGRVYPALAAYNAGPGNARRWLERTLAACADHGKEDDCTFDYDLFVEIIHLRETRLYVRQIYKHYSVYQHLYGKE